MAEVSITELWGRICVYNKLVTQQEFGDCVAVLQKNPGKTTIDKVLIERGLVKPEHADAIRKKINDLVAKQKAGVPPLPAARPAPPLPQGAPGKSAPGPGSGTGMTLMGISKPGAPAKSAASQNRPAVPPGAPPPPVETGEIAVADEQAAKEAREGEHWSPSEIDWTTTGHDIRGDKQEYNDPALQPIDLVSLDDAGQDRTSLIIKEDRSIKPVNSPHEGTKFQAPPALTRASEMMQSTVAPEDRIPCAVPPGQIDPMALDLLKKALEMGASDVHFSSNVPPFFRLFGAVHHLDLPKLTPEKARQIVLGFMDDAQQQHFLKHHDLDFSFEHPEVGRARVNALEQFRGPDIVFRLIPTEPPTLTSLGLPDIVARFSDYTQGLLLVTGPAGCGKSTTAAAVIRLVNENRNDHVITIEDPVEFIHHSINCNVTQRQVPRDTKTFSSALRAALREDPDVIMIGEMRDLDTVSLAIRAAETGHLVIGTLQTKSASRTIDRIIDVYPTDQQATIRTMLSESLRGIISQQLVPRADGKGRVLVLEILRCTTAVANLIRDSKTYQLPSLMQTGRKVGQRTMDDSLEELLAAGTITRETAMKVAENPKRFGKAEAVIEGTSRRN